MTVAESERAMKSNTFPTIILDIPDSPLPSLPGPVAEVTRHVQDIVKRGDACFVGNGAFTLF